MINFMIKMEPPVNKIGSITGGLKVFLQKKDLQILNQNVFKKLVE